LPGAESRGASGAPTAWPSALHRKMSGAAADPRRLPWEAWRSRQGQHGMPLKSRRAGRAVPGRATSGGASLRTGCRPLAYRHPACCPRDLVLSARAKTRAPSRSRFLWCARSAPSREPCGGTGAPPDGAAGLQSPLAASPWWRRLAAMVRPSAAQARAGTGEHPWADRARGWELSFLHRGGLAVALGHGASIGNLGKGGVNARTAGARIISRGAGSAPGPERPRTAGARIIGRGAGSAPWCRRLRQAGAR
jgi:hypothetical protein